MAMEQDYLDFDGLINFLDQKGYKWNARRTTDLLLEAITDSKLTPVFSYRGEITVTYAKFVGVNEWEDVKKDTCRLQGYFSANAYDLVDLYQDYFTCVPNCLILNGQHVRPYKIFGNPAPIVTDHQKSTEGIEVCFLHLSCGSFIDGCSHTVTEFLYPVEQLEVIFDETNKGLLAVQLDNDLIRSQTNENDHYNIEDVGVIAIIQPATLPKNKTLYTVLGNNQKLLIDYEVFTFEQIICLIADSNPELITHDSKFLSYWNAIDKAQETDKLIPFNNKGHIAAQQVKEWLARHNLIYKGFNDNLSIDPVEQVKALTEQLKSAQDTIRQITHNYERALASIETSKKAPSTNSFMISSPATEQAGTPADASILQTILDDSYEHHAPDLKHAVQLWIDLYIYNKIGGNSHTGRADHWMGKNTDYNAEVVKADQKSIDRIREVATPLKNFGAKRSRETKK